MKWGNVADAEDSGLYVFGVHPLIVSLVSFFAGVLVAFVLFGGPLW